MLSYGALKLLPFWDPLRGDPRFEQIVTSHCAKVRRNAPVIGYWLSGQKKFIVD
jgi:hypothetical protein